MTTVTTRDPILAREEISDLIDSLPESELHSVKRYLQFLHYLDDPETLGRVEAQAVKEDLDPRGKPDRNAAAVSPVTPEEIKRLLDIVEDYRLKPAGWFIQFTHSTNDDPPKRVGTKTEALIREGRDQ